MYLGVFIFQFVPCLANDEHDRKPSLVFHPRHSRGMHPLPLKMLPSTDVWDVLVSTISFLLSLLSVIPFLCLCVEMPVFFKMDLMSFSVNALFLKPCSLPGLCLEEYLTLPQFSPAPQAIIQRCLQGISPWRCNFPRSNQCPSIGLPVPASAHSPRTVSHAFISLTLTLNGKTPESYACMYTCGLLSSSAPLRCM